MKITVNDNGSLRIEGEGIELFDGKGNAFDLNGRKKFSLCRCGGSSTKPFCDASHKTNGFQSVCEAYALPPMPPKL